MSRIECNNCKTYYEDENELGKFIGEEGIFKGCKKCRTDEYLTDIKNEEEEE